MFLVFRRMLHIDPVAVRLLKVEEGRGCIRGQARGDLKGACPWSEGPGHVPSPTRCMFCNLIMDLLVPVSGSPAALLDLVQAIVRGAFSLRPLPPRRVQCPHMATYRAGKTEKKNHGIQNSGEEEIARARCSHQRIRVTLASPIRTLSRSTSSYQRVNFITQAITDNLCVFAWKIYF